MQAAIIEKNGDASVLQMAEIQKPTISSEEVLVKQTYAGVNFIDIYFREGIYPVPNLPYILGKEGIGKVVEVGDKAGQTKIGQRVAYAFAQNTYAEFVKVNQNQIVQVPDAIDDQIAITAMLQGMTAHYLSKSTYSIKNKDKVLIHAGAGGVGLLLIQMAKLFGAEVYTTVSNQEKQALTKQIGADHAIIYENYRFLDELFDLSKGEKMDVVYDSVGKATFDESLQAIKPRGMMVLFGQSSGAVKPFDLNRLNPAGSLYITRPSLAHYIADKSALNQRARDLFDLISQDKLKINIGSLYPLNEVQQAHLALESRTTSGKVLLQLSD